MNPKRLKGLISLCLALSLLMVLTSCKPKNEPASSNASGTNSKTSVSEAEDFWPVESSEPESSSESEAGESKSGTTSTAPKYTLDRTSGKLFDDPVTISVTTFEHPNQPYNLKAAKFKEITEKTNVTLKFNIIPQGNYPAKQAAMLSSGVLTDLTFLKLNVMQQYSTALYHDLTDRIEKEAPNYYKWIKNDVEAKKIRINGRSYGFINLNAGMHPTSNQSRDIYGYLPVIRYDILDKHNIPMPKTWDQWFQAMKTLKSHYPDSTPFSGRTSAGVLLYWSYALGAQYDLHYNHDKNKYVIGALEPEFKTILQFMNDSYKEGILDPNFASVNTNTWNQGVQDSKIFFWIDNNGFAESQTLALKKSNPNAKMATMPLMTNAFGKKRGLQFADHQYNDYLWVISAKSKQTSQIMKFMNWCYSDEGMYVNSYGKEGETFKLLADGGVSLPSSLTSKFKNSTSPDYAWMSSTGVGMLNFSPLNSSITNMSKALGKYENTTYAALKNDLNAGNIKQVVGNPTLPAKIVDDITEKHSNITRSLNAEIRNFVTGEKNMNTFDQYIAQLKSQGAEDVIKAFNDALGSLK